MDEAYIGEVFAVGFNYAPRNFMMCNGQLLAIATNQALFSLLGTTYGGDGRTTFALPDLRGRAALHAGQGAGLSYYSEGQVSGTETVTLSVGQMPAHTHTASMGATGADATADTPGGANLPAKAVDANRDSYNFYDVHDATSVMPVTINNAGGSQGHENRQPSLAINYIICIYGVFPSRN